VYRARGPEGLVALKVLESDPRRASELRQRFEQEGRLRIDHPNVVRTMASGVDEGRAWIAFELLEGRSLAALLAERGRLGAGEALSLALQVADGLAAAHAAGVVHRDLKPGNLMVVEDGTLKLVDFGIARITERDTRLTATGHLVGTAAYLSPEQARGDEDVGPASDVWSLGVVLYEALTARNPFERGTLMPTMLAVLAEEPPPVTALRSDVPRSLSRLIARCLERGLDRRFPDAAALLEALREIDLDEAVAAASGATALAQSIPASALPPGEQRVVAVVLADGVIDREAVAGAIEDAGGVVVPLGDRALGLFGSTRWEGDEMDRAASAALALRAHAAAVGVASGRASYSGTTGITGSVLVAAEEGCGAQLEGVALD
jgi:serine/threonine-protein kinase